MKVRFVYPRFERHAESHPELREHVPCEEYLGPPSLGIAYLAASTPPEWEVEMRDDRLQDVGLDDVDDVDLVAISTFTASAKRALALADAFRAVGKKVVLGGIFPTMLPDVAARHADSVVVGEGEGVWPSILRDVKAGNLQPRYRASAPVDPASLPLPRTDLYVDGAGDRAPDDYPVQTSRGCQLSCFACAIPASMGPMLRPLPLDHILGQIDQLAARGRLASFTEDTSFFLHSMARARFAELLDALAEREVPARISYIGISMPMILATPDHLFERMRKAGVKMFYLVGGFDPITRRAFTGCEPKALERAFNSIRRAFDQGIEPYTSFLVGHDEDDEGTFDRMIEFADRAGIRKAEFAILTPYPGTPVWHALEAEGRLLHHDWSKYNDANVVFQPKQMSPDRLQEGYLHLWREFYRPRQSLRGLDREERTIQF